MDDWDGRTVTQVFTREDGTQVLVTVYLSKEGRVDSIEVAERRRQWETWGPPIQ